MGYRLYHQEDLLTVYNGKEVCYIRTATNGGTIMSKNYQYRISFRGKNQHSLFKLRVDMYENPNDHNEITSSRVILDTFSLGL